MITESVSYCNMTICLEDIETNDSIMYVSIFHISFNWSNFCLPQSEFY